MCSFILLVPEYAKLYAIQMIQFFLFKNGKWKKVIKTLFYGDRDIINWCAILLMANDNESKTKNQSKTIHMQFHTPRPGCFLPGAVFFKAISWGERWGKFYLEGGWIVKHLNFYQFLFLYFNFYHGHFRLSKNSPRNNILALKNYWWTGG